MVGKPSCLFKVCRKLRALVDVRGRSHQMRVRSIVTVLYRVLVEHGYQA